MTLTPGDQVALFPHVYAKLGYDALRDFTPVSTVCTVQFLLTVGSLVPTDVKTVADFVSWCRANPKLASYGSPGEGTRPAFYGGKFGSNGRRTDDPCALQRRTAGRAGPPGRPDCRRAERSLQRSSPRRGWPGEGSCTTAPRRSAILPDVPTAREAGYPAMEGVESFGLFVPIGTPNESSPDSTARSARVWKATP